MYSEEDIAHPELFEILRAWRSRLAKERSVGAFLIMHQKVLIQIVMELPVTKKELKGISGVGKKTIENYGDDILEMVESYRKTMKQ